MHPYIDAGQIGCRQTVKSASFFRLLRVAEQLDVPLGEEFGVLLRLYRKPFDKRRLGDHVVPEVRHRHELSFFEPAQHRALSENARKSGRIICQRPREKYCGLLREFPGGKIEPGETAEAVLL